MNSALTIIAGFLSLSFTKIPSVRVTSIYAALGAALTMILSLTFTPAALSYGLQFHAAGPAEHGWQVVEIWPSSEALERFFEEVLRPAMVRMGVPMAEVTIVDIHNIVGLQL